MRSLPPTHKGKTCIPKLNAGPRRAPLPTPPPGFPGLLGGDSTSGSGARAVASPAPSMPLGSLSRVSAPGWLFLQISQMYYFGDKNEGAL